MQPKDSASVAIAQILEVALADQRHHDDAELALSVIRGIWGEADETRSGIYASAQTLFAPWEDTRNRQELDDQTIRRS